MKGTVAYLNFDGNCGQAMKFYERCFGGELTLMPFSESPADFPPEAKNRVMHARLAKGSSVVLMASDIMPGQPFAQGSNFFIMVPCESVDEIDRLFNALGEKGQILMPLSNTFWAARFGMVKDQFGVSWMLNFEKA
jgi:PhnB protein